MSKVALKTSQTRDNYFTTTNIENVPFISINFGISVAKQIQVYWKRINKCSKIKTGKKNNGCKCCCNTKDSSHFMNKKTKQKKNVLFSR